MKRLIYLFLFFSLILLFSCSDDDKALPIIQIYTSTLDFGEVKVNYGSTMSFEIKNESSEVSLKIKDIILDDSHFSITGISTFFIDADSAKSINVVFVPDSIGIYSSTLRVISNASNRSSFSINLEGIGIE